MRPTLSIVIPCLNEQAAITAVLNKLKSLVDSPDFENEFSRAETIVVDDGSSDNSIAELKKHPWVQLITHRTCRGYGAALKTGFKASQGDYICFLDMDDSYDPLDILVLWSKLKTKGDDIVFGNRLHHRQGMPYTRLVGNLFFSQLTKRIHGGKVTDVATGFRLFKREMLQYFDLPEDGLDYSLALTLRILTSQSKMSEAPIRYHSRLGESKLNIIGDGLRFLRTYRTQNHANSAQNSTSRTRLT